jgi:hypothetical protein
MTSLFTRFVAQGVEVPVSKEAHLDTSEVVTANVGQAATFDVQVEVAPENQTSFPTDAPITAVDGTQSPK